MQHVLIMCSTYHLCDHNYYFARHLQADSWKIISAADDKTLKVSFVINSAGVCIGVGEQIEATSGCGLTLQW